MRLRLHGATHRGHVRPGNEDAFLAGRWVLGVADGVGGAPAGEVASRIAVDHLARVDAERPATVTEAADALEGAFREAARAIRAAVAERPERAGMATTLTAAAVHDGQLVIAHVGDSRAYLLRAGGLRRLTEDHTAVGEAVRAGLLDEDEAARHPGRHVLVEVLRDDERVAVATPPPEPLEPGDWLLLCTDGLTETCDDAVIGRVLAESPDPETAAARLLSEALERGGPDNVTVVVAEVD